MTHFLQSVNPLLQQPVLGPKSLQKEKNGWYESNHSLKYVIRGLEYVVLQFVVLDSHGETGMST